MDWIVQFSVVETKRPLFNKKYGMQVTWFEHYAVSAAVITS